MLVKVDRFRWTVQISERRFDKERNCGGQLVGSLLFWFILVAFAKYDGGIPLPMHLRTTIHVHMYLSMYGEAYTSKGTGQG